MKKVKKGNRVRLGQKSRKERRGSVKESAKEARTLLEDLSARSHIAQGTAEICYTADPSSKKKVRDFDEYLGDGGRKGSVGSRKNSRNRKPILRDQVAAQPKRKKVNLAVAKENRPEVVKKKPQQVLTKEHLDHAGYRAATQQKTELFHAGLIEHGGVLTPHSLNVFLSGPIPESNRRKRKVKDASVEDDNAVKTRRSYKRKTHKPRHLVGKWKLEKAV